MINIKVPKHFKLVHVTSQMAILILDSDEDGWYSDVTGCYAISITRESMYGDYLTSVRAIGTHFKDTPYSHSVEYGEKDIQEIADYVMSEREL